MKKILFLPIFLAFFFCWVSPTLATEKKFYLGLYGHDFDYFEKSEFNAVLAQYALWRFEQQPEVIDGFIKDFAANKPSGKIILVWGFTGGFSREDKEKLCAYGPSEVEPPFQEAWWNITQQMINYHHQQGSLKYIWGITLSEETMYCPNNLGTMYNRTRNLLDSPDLGYGKDSGQYVRVLQWPSNPKWYDEYGNKKEIWWPYLSSLPADGYVYDSYSKDAAFIKREIDEYKNHFPDRPFILCVAVLPDIRNDDQVDLIDQLFAQRGQPDSLIFYAFGQSDWLWRNQASHTVKDRENWQYIHQYTRSHCCSNLWADMNFSGILNEEDLKAMISSFYQTAGEVGDGNQDYYLNSLDFAKVRNLIGQ